MKLLAVLFVTFASSHAYASFSNFSSSEPPAVSYQEYMKNPNAYPSDVPTWVTMDMNQFEVPRDAVFGGYDINSASFVMRADHTDEATGIYVGKILGKYFPWKREGYIAYQGVEYKKFFLDIMTHKRAVWTESGDNNRPDVEGSHSSKVCRFNKDGFWTPGKLDHNMRICTISWHGGEASSAGFEVLRRMIC